MPCNAEGLRQMIILEPERPILNVSLATPSSIEMRGEMLSVFCLCGGISLGWDGLFS